MDGMLPAPNFGVIFDALIRWLDNRVITAMYDRECCTGCGGPSLCLAIFFILVVGSTPSQTRQASSWLASLQHGHTPPPKSTVLWVRFLVGPFKIGRVGR